MRLLTRHIWHSSPNQQKVLTNNYSRCLSANRNYRINLFHMLIKATPHWAFHYWVWFNVRSISTFLYSTGNTIYIATSNLFAHLIFLFMVDLTQNQTNQLKIKMNQNFAKRTCLLIKDYYSTTYLFHLTNFINLHPTWSSKDLNSYKFLQSSQTKAKAPLLNT